MSMTARDRRRQEEQDATRVVRRRAAVVAATLLFAEGGFHATSMADIAGAAGLSLKALYDGFPSKDALFEAVLADVGDKFSALLRSPTPDDDPVGAAVGIVRRLVELLEANAAALRLYSRGADGVPAELRKRGIDPFAEFRGRVEDILADLVREAQRAGRAQRMDAGVLGRAILTLTIAEARHRLEGRSPVADVAGELALIVEALLA